MQQLVWVRTGVTMYSKSFLLLYPYYSLSANCDATLLRTQTHTRPHIIIWVKRKIWSTRKETRPCIRFGHGAVDEMHIAHRSLPHGSGTRVEKIIYLKRKPTKIIPGNIVTIKHNLLFYIITINFVHFHCPLQRYILSVFARMQRRKTLRWNYARLRTIQKCMV